MPGAGLSQKLSRIIGQPRAMALSLTGEFLEADEAHRCGLVSHLVSPEELLPLAWRMAGRISGSSPQVIREMKRVIKEGAGLSLADGMRLERDSHEQWARAADMNDVLARRDGVFSKNRGAIRNG